MERTSTTVPINANRDYVRALKAYAYARGRTIADVVREAVDASFGAALQPHIDFFAAQSGSEKLHSEVEDHATP